MPLFGVTIGLAALRDIVAANLGGNPSAAEAILWQKLRRGEIIAFCEWAYAKEGTGEVLVSHRLSTEPWITAEKIDWSAGTLSVRSVGQEIRFASSIYFWASDIDFLDETYSAEEVEKEIPPKRRSPGAPPHLMNGVKTRILEALRRGQQIEDRDHEFITSEFGRGASRNTCVKALREALSEFKSTQS